MSETDRVVCKSDRNFSELNYYLNFKCLNFSSYFGVNKIRWLAIFSVKQKINMTSYDLETGRRERNWGGAA